MKKIYQRAMAVALAGTSLLGLGLWHKSQRIAPVPSKTVTQTTDALPTGVSEATLADIRSSLEKQEYHISYDAQEKKLQSPNRANNIRAYYEPGKLTIQTRVDTTGQGFKVELVNDGVFADGKLLYAPQVNAKAQHHENKVQISHEAFTEEFINNEDGLRQNFIVQTAPAGTRQLQVKMTAKGLEVEQGAANELRFYSKAADGQTRNELVYSDLKCWDANKQPLTASLAYVDNHIQISVDVANAAYPVTIDPIIVNGTPQNSNKVLEINQSYMWLGFSVSSAGDVNGDGYSDVLVGAPHYDKTKSNEGGAFVYRGGASGLTLTAVTFVSGQQDAEMGYSVSTAGDFNGDGYGDIVVGSDKYDNGQNDEGRATVFYGSSVGCGSANKTDLEVNYPGAYFGRSVGGSTDVNADGYDDVIVGAPFYGNGSSDEGGAWVFYGSPDGVNTTSSFSTESNQLLAHMGASVSGGGDLNGDGYGDFVVGIPGYTQSGAVNSGSCWAYFGNNGNHGNVWQNKRNNLRLYNNNLSSPMSYQQATNVSFGLGLTGTSFTGRNNGRLMWDFATPGQKFSCVAGNPKDYPITTSTKTDNGQQAFYSLPPYEFKELVAKPVGSAFRIRGRVKYELTTALTGQRYSPWRYSSKPIIYIQPLTVPEEALNEIFVPRQPFENAERDKLVTVYPNPVADRLFIQSTNMEEVTSLQLVSANGTMAFTSTKPQSEIDVKHLAAGTYILVINRKDGSKSSRKVLIRK